MHGFHSYVLRMVHFLITLFTVSLPFRTQCVSRIAFNVSLPPLW